MNSQDVHAGQENDVSRSPVGRREHTGLVILAAGSASRMGRPKQLMEWRGRPLLRHAAETALASAASPVVVVLGHAAGQMRIPLQGLPVQIVENPDWEAGIGTSIRAGIQALSGQNVHSAILMLADQPLLTPEILNRLATLRQSSGRPVVCSGYSGTVGVPVLFGRELFGDLLALEGTQGCKGVILVHRDDALTVPCPEAEFDVDTPEDFERLQREG